MTGTPLDLTPFGSLLAGLGWLYWSLMLALVALALWLPRRWWIKLPLAAGLAALFILPVQRHADKRVVEASAGKARLDAALAHFEMRCKGAGEKITRTVENVEGVVWMKWREPRDVKDDYDQFKLFDPYGRDCTEQGCIDQFLRVTSGAKKNPEQAALRKAGYLFVETIDPADQKRYRYAGTIELRWSAEAIERHKKETGQDPPALSHTFATKRTPIDSYSARYGVTWDDISTREDREHWIAGGSIKVIDLRTNELIAERVGFLIDTGQGGTGGFRSPWGWARSYSKACPTLTSDQTTRFVFKVLQPIKLAE